MKLALIRLFLMLMPLVSCLETGRIELSSTKDYSKQLLSISAEDVEAGGIAKIRLSLNYVTPRDVKVHLKAEAAGAVAGFDFEAIDGEFTLPAGKSYLDIPLVTFTRIQPLADRQVRIVLSDVRGAEVGDQTQVTIAIAESSFRDVMRDASLTVSGNAHTCAKLADKKVYCWGANSYAQITGTAATSTKLAKTLVANLPDDPIKLSAAWDGTCALYASGDIQCWGRNNALQLSQPGLAFNAIRASGSILTPAQLALKAIDVATGYVATCAAFTDGSVRCQGYGTAGQLGNGGVAHQSAMTAVVGLPSPALKVATGNFTSCAVLNTGEVWCWGQNTYGNVGNGLVDNVIYSSPQATLVTADAVQIGSGADHYCALTNAGAVKCWGRNNAGQLGTDTAGASSGTPLTVTLPRPAKSIVIGTFMSCAILNDGEVWCWGDNYAGALGDGTALAGRATPGKVLGIPDRVAAAGSGYGISCVILETDDRLLCWGDNNLMAVTGAEANVSLPADDSVWVGAKLLDKALSIFNIGASNYASGCAVLATGEAQCFGSNNLRQLGRNSVLAYSAVPATVSGLGAGLANTLEYAIGFGCSLLQSGAVNCWGDNALGQVGFAGGATVDPPQTATGLNGGVKQISASTSHACARLDDGTVKCWGQSTYGQAGACADQATPLAIVGLTDVTSVTAGPTTSCAVTANGTVKCWGDNSDGLFGNGMISTACAINPVTALVPHKVRKVVLGKIHACALTEAGAVWCWGNNARGQLGRSLSGEQLTPIPVDSLKSDVVDLAAGDLHNCAALRDGSVRCWGDDSSGQLGLNYRHTGKIIYNPIQPMGLGAGIVRLHGTALNTCGFTAEGYAKCWGANSTEIRGYYEIPFPHEVNDVPFSF